MPWWCPKTRVRMLAVASLNSNQRQIVEYIEAHGPKRRNAKARPTVEAFVASSGLQAVDEFVALSKDALLRLFAEFRRHGPRQRWQRLLPTLARALSLRVTNADRNRAIHYEHVRALASCPEAATPIPLALRPAYDSVRHKPIGHAEWLPGAVGYILAEAKWLTPPSLDAARGGDALVDRVRQLGGWNRRVSRHVVACIDAMKAHPSVDAAGTYHTHRRVLSDITLQRFPLLLLFPSSLGRFVENMLRDDRPEIVVQMAQRLYDLAPDHKKQLPCETRLCRSIAKRLLRILRWIAAVTDGERVWHTFEVRLANPDALVDLAARIVGHWHRHRCPQTRLDRTVCTRSAMSTVVAKASYEGSQMIMLHPFLRMRPWSWRTSACSWIAAPCCRTFPRRSGLCGATCSTAWTPWFATKTPTENMHCTHNRSVRSREPC